MKNIAEVLKGSEGVAFMTLLKSAMQLREGVLKIFKEEGVSLDHLPDYSGRHDDETLSQQTKHGLAVI
jgi:hypothetical protein